MRISARASSLSLSSSSLYSIFLLMFVIRVIHIFVVQDDALFIRMGFYVVKVDGEFAKKLR